MTEGPPCKLPRIEANYYDVNALIDKFKNLKLCPDN